MKKPILSSTSISITKWAYQKSRINPFPDWNDQITTLDNAELLITLVSDAKCPQRAALLRCLYSLVGISVSKHVDVDMMKLKLILDKANLSTDRVILNWVQRSRIILKDLRKYDYIEWRKGGLSEKDLPIIN